MAISDFTDLMPTEATYQNSTGYDIYGKPTAGDVVNFKCHISRTESSRYSADGLTVVEVATIQMDGLYDITKEALLTLPDGSTPKITAVKTFFDETGAHHTTVEVEG